MKCFSLIYILFSFTALSQEYYIDIQNSAIISPGDEVEIIITRIDGKTREVNFEGKIINKLLFILRDDKQETVALVKSAPLKSIEDQKYTIPQFILRGTKFHDKKIQTNYTVMGLDYNVDENSRTQTFYITVLILFLLIVLLPFLIKNWKKRKEKKLFLVKINVFRNRIINSNKRVDFEYIYIKKREIEKYLSFDSNAFENFCLYLNEIQFSKKWNEDEEIKINKLASKFTNSIGAKNGI